MGLTLLDTGAVIGFLDRDDAFHRSAHDAIAAAIGDGGFLALSVVSQAELLTGVGLGHHPEGLLTGFLAELAVRIIPVDERVAARAAEIRSAHTAMGAGGRRRPTIRMPDALILATASVTPDVDRLVVTDRGWPQPAAGVELRVLSAMRDRS
ncbi:MAG: type II toxin-antitoxin system VapC family toxin [Solirubrobacteraceae bacterium]|nr:type II toxin-antitoxin system VapC family toxin [Solirubrobacteraceae bacterium]